MSVEPCPADLAAPERGEWVPDVPTGLLLAWHLGGTLLVVLVPGMVRPGRPFWAVPASLAIQSAVLGLAYLSITLLLSLGRIHGRGSIARICAAGVACFVVGEILMLALPGFSYSRT